MTNGVCVEDLTSTMTNWVQFPNESKKLFCTVYFLVSVKLFYYETEDKMLDKTVLGEKMTVITMPKCLTC